MFRTNDVNQESLDAVAVAKDALVRAKKQEIKSESFTKITTSSDIYKLSPTNSKPSTDSFTFSKDSTLDSKYKIHYVIDPTNVDNLGLYEISIYIVEGNAIRATNYGYIDGNSKPSSVVK